MFENWVLFFDICWIIFFVLMLFRVFLIKVIMSGLYLFGVFKFVDVCLVLEVKIMFRMVLILFVKYFIVWLFISSFLVEGLVVLLLCLFFVVMVLMMVWNWVSFCLVVLLLVICFIRFCSLVLVFVLEVSIKMIGFVFGVGFFCVGVFGVVGVLFIGGLVSVGFCFVGKVVVFVFVIMVGLGEGGSCGGWVLNGGVICGFVGGCGVIVFGDRIDFMFCGEVIGLGRVVGMVGVMCDIFGVGGWLEVGG